MVQWLRLPTQNTGSQGSIPGQGTRSHVLQLKIPRGLPWWLSGKESTYNAGDTGEAAEHTHVTTDLVQTNKIKK